MDDGLAVDFCKGVDTRDKPALSKDEEILTLLFRTRLSKKGSLLGFQGGGQSARPRGVPAYLPQDFAEVGGQPCMD
jgi:hypothetical protein